MHCSGIVCAVIIGALLCISALSENDADYEGDDDDYDDADDDVRDTDLDDVSFQSPISYFLLISFSYSYVTTACASFNVFV